MSPRRHGSTRSVAVGVAVATPTSPRAARAPTTAATSAASRSRSSSAVGSSASGVGAEEHDRRRPPARPSRTGSSATYSGCDSGSATMSSRNIVVDDVDHRTRGAEVAGEPAGRRAERRAGPEERGDVGAAEAVDRLLRVADHEQPAGVDRELVPPVGAGVGLARREQRGEVALDRVGVLELVEQQAGVPGAQPPAHVPPVVGVAQHRAGEHEEVVELELARAAAGRGLAQGELRQLPRQAAHDRPRTSRRRGRVDERRGAPATRSRTSSTGHSAGQLSLRAVRHAALRAHPR